MPREHNFEETVIAVGMNDTNGFDTSGRLLYLVRVSLFTVRPMIFPSLKQYLPTLYPLHTFISRLSKKILCEL